MSDGTPGDQADGADFADLEAQAAAIEGPAAAAAPGALAQGAPTVDPVAVAAEAAELAGALQLARLLVRPMFGWWPDFGTVWSDAQIRQIAQAGAEVCIKHGWTMGDLMAKWGPYVGLALATAPPCVATYQAIGAHKAALAAQARQAKASAAGAAASGEPQ